MSIRLIFILFILMFVNQCIGASYGAFREGFQKKKLLAGLWRYATVLAGYAAIALTVHLARNALDGIEYVSGILMIVLGANPLLALKYLWKGAFGTAANLGTTLAKATPLIFTALCACFAYKCGVFNLGGEGQFIMKAMWA